MYWDGWFVSSVLSQAGAAKRTSHPWPGTARWESAARAVVAASAATRNRRARVRVFIIDRLFQGQGRGRLSEASRVLGERRDQDVAPGRARHRHEDRNARD